MKITDYVGTLFDNVDNPNKITVAFTMGNKAIEHGHTASIILITMSVKRILIRVLK